MHANDFIQKILGKIIHKSRIRLLNELVNGIVHTKKLSLTQLGRGLLSKIQERSGIRKVDRALANKYFQENAIEIYRCIANKILSVNKHPVLLVDWTKVPNSTYYALRASLAADGRALTIYEEVHCGSKHGSRTVHNNFLDNLESVLPANCRPIIVTDAGFKNPWFKSVQNKGWDYVGRIRGLTTFSEIEKDTYQEIKTLFTVANQRPSYYGEVTLTKKNPLKTEVYLYKQKLTGRISLTKTKKKRTDKDSLHYAKTQREPWVIVTSLKHCKNTAKKVIKIYKQRMSIEEAFRDVKSARYGLSMDNNHTIRPERLTVWLMLAALATLYAWVVGFFAEKQNLQFQFQANTVKNRRVLSYFYLGCQVIKRKITIYLNMSRIQFWKEEPQL